MTKLSTGKQAVSVAIIPGFAEGWLTGRRMRTELRHHGFKPVKDVAVADIVIAHSGGCFIIPPYVAAKLVVCINPPYWPGKALRTSGVEKLRLGLKASRKNHTIGLFVKAQIRNAVYIWNVPRARAMLRGIRNGTAWRLKVDILLIRSDDDTFSPDIDLMPFETDISSVTIPGGHDDCWDAPAPYVKAMIDAATRLDILQRQSQAQPTEAGLIS